MDIDGLVPIALFVCITYAVKLIVDARMRHNLMKTAMSEELLRSAIRAEEAQRANGSLRWGIVLIALALGFGLIEILAFRQLTPGAIAVLAGVTGLGNIAYFVLSRQIGRREPPAA